MKKLDIEALKNLLEDADISGPLEIDSQCGDPEGAFRGILLPPQTNRLGREYRTYAAQYVLPHRARLFSIAPDLVKNAIADATEIALLKRTYNDLFDAFKAEQESASIRAATDAKRIAELEEELKVNSENFKNAINDLAAKLYPVKP